MPDDARDRIAATLGEDPFGLISELRDAGMRKAKAEALAYRLDHERKSLLARLASEIATANPKASMSEAKLERMARGRPEYSRHLDGAAAAIEERELANSEYWAIRARLEWLEKAVSHDNALSRLER